ncbi:UNVERIFIED_CONTAM: hypothetical protein Slati_3162500 [Sesamum latifolium]|uniref:Uncharacterized protein n=1 Tax=Sesamum latifolium TaxID=2727402 RepID=A0AAW2UZ25_9LAMI
MENTPPEDTYASGGWSNERQRMELLRMMELRDWLISRTMGFATGGCRELWLHCHSE